MENNLEAVMRASLDAGARKYRAPETRWASVEDHNQLTGALDVVVDGDDLATPAIDVTGALFAPGQRVLVLYSPPQAAHVIGCLPLPPQTYTPELDNIDVDDGDLEGEFSVRDGMVDYSVLITLGTAGDVTGQIGVGLPILGSGLVVTEWLTLCRATIGSDRFVGAGVYQPATSDTMMVAIGGDDHPGGNLWAATVPADWGPGDQLRVTGRYPMRLPIENEDT